MRSTREAVCLFCYIKNKREDYGAIMRGVLLGAGRKGVIAA